MRSRRRDPFPFIREHLLNVCGHAVAFRESRTFDEFRNDIYAQYAAAKMLEEIGEHMWPGNGHAAPDTAIKFRATRNELSHEYVRAKPQDVWSRLGEVAELRRQIEEHRDPPPVRRPRRPPGNAGQNR